MPGRTVLCFLMLFLLLFFANCMRLITQDMLAYIDRGISSSELHQYTSGTRLDKFDAADSAGIPYHFESYMMQTGSTTRAIYVAGYGGAPGYTTYQTVPTGDPFYFAFRNDSLFFWGHLAEFSREASGEIQKAYRMIETRNIEKAARRRR